MKNDLTTTENLLKKLSEKNIKFEDFVKYESGSYVVNSIRTYWYDLIDRSNISKYDIINKADIGYSYFYDIIKGKKCPSRDKIVRIIMAMNLSFEDCQNTLKLYNWSPLYVKDKRDSAIIYALTHDYSISQLIDLMKKNGIEILK